MIMEVLEYPTKNLLENYLKKVVFNSSNICLCNSIKILGRATENHDVSGKYGTFPSASFTGIDIPVLVKNEKSKTRTIAIVAQAPLRSEKDKMLEGIVNLKNQTIIGTPFALHYKQNCYPKTEVYREIIRKLLDKGFMVYITDANKIYPQRKDL